MVTLTLTEQQYDLIQKALSHLHSHQIKLAVMNRTWSKKQFKYVDARKREERVAEIKAKHSAAADVTLSLIRTIDNQTNQ